MADQTEALDWDTADRLKRGRRRTREPDPVPINHAVTNVDIAEAVDWLGVYWKDLRFLEVDYSTIAETGEVTLHGRKYADGLVVKVKLRIVEVEPSPDYRWEYEHD